MRQSHGMKHTRIYETWLGMKKRCNNPKSTSYPRYGAKGIRVCQQWEHDFTAFHQWAVSAGYRDDLTIDRIDNTKGYQPDNCRWVTRAEQARNKTNNIVLTHDGKTMILAEWCRFYDFPYKIAKQRYENTIKIGKPITFDELFFKGNRRLKSVIQCKQDGTIVNVWSSLAEAQKSGFNHTSVSDCCKGKRKTAYGYIWKYV